MALTDDIVRNNPQSPAIIHLFARDGFTWKKGSIIAHRKGSCLAEVPLSGSPRSDLIVRGVAMAAGTSVGAGDGVVAIAIDPGYQGDFETGAGGNEITADNVGQECYAYDDNTLYLTDAAGTLSPAGRVKYVDDGGLVTVFFDPNPIDYILAGEGTVSDLEARLAAVTTGDGASMVGIEDAGARFAGSDLEAALTEVPTLTELASVANGEGASLIGIEDVATQYTATDVEGALAEVKLIADDALPSSDVKKGTGTLVAGTVTINTATITASSRIMVQMTDPGAGAITGFASLKVTNKVVGAPGSFDVTAIDDAKATIATAVCVFDWIVIG